MGGIGAWVGMVRVLQTKDLQNVAAIVTNLE